MKSVLAYLKHLFQQQPVRVAGYTAVAGLLAALVAKGYLDHDVSDFVLAVVTAAVGATGTEAVTAHTYAAANVEPVDPTPAPPAN